jgi:integrase
MGIIMPDLGMNVKAVEVKHIRRCDVDLVKRLVHVRRSKNETSHRVIPLNASAVEAAARMFERADLLGHTEPPFAQCK